MTNSQSKKEEETKAEEKGETKTIIQHDSMLM